MAGLNQRKKDEISSALEGVLRVKKKGKIPPNRLAQDNLDDAYAKIK